MVLTAPQGGLQMIVYEGFPLIIPILISALLVIVIVVASRIFREIVRVNQLLTDIRERLSAHQ